jgi:DNA-binding transcriptional ArsR family regulator
MCILLHMLRRAELEVLATVDSGDTISELASKLDNSESHLSLVVTGLAEKGLVYTTRDGRHERVVQTCLSFYLTSVAPLTSVRRSVGRHHVAGFVVGSGRYVDSRSLLARSLDRAQIRSHRLATRDRSRPRRPLGPLAKFHSRRDRPRRFAPVSLCSVRFS